MDKFSQRLKDLRKLYKVTQKQTSDMTGITGRVYQSYEYGKVVPTATALVSLGDFFYVSLDYLIGRNDDPQHEYYFQKAKDALLFDMPEAFIILFKYAKAKGLKQQPITIQEHFQLIKWFREWKQEIMIQQEYYDAKKAYDEQEEKKYYEKQFKTKSPFQSIEPKSKGIVDAIKEKFFLKEPVFNYSNKKTSADWKRDENLEDNFHRLRDMSLDFPYIEFPSIPMPNQLSEYLLPIVEADIQEGIADYVKKIGD